MKVTVLNDVGTMYDLEIDPQMSLENMMALLEAEVCSTSILFVTKITLKSIILPAVWHSRYRAESFARWTRAERWQSTHGHTGRPGQLCLAHSA